MERRALLAAAGTALTGVVAGCSSVMPDDEQPSYAFGIHNGSRESHTVTVRIGNSLEGHFQEETFEMDAETANERVSVEDTPSRIFLEIDSSGERSFPWPASTSQLGEAARQADIWYEPDRDQEILIQEG